MRPEEVEEERVVLPCRDPFLGAEEVEAVQP
jgi:hypothetical protein